MGKLTYLKKLTVFALLFFPITVSWSRTDINQEKRATTYPTVENLIVFPGDGELYLHWSPVDTVSYPDFLDYVIIQQNGTVIDSLTDTLYTVTEYDGTPLTNGTTYGFKIKARFGGGTTVSDAHYGIPDSREDTFGYSWSSNMDIGGGQYPSFSWEDISTTGTEVVYYGDDVLSEKIEMGFEFPFYNWKFSSLRISNSGYITFIEENNVDDYLDFPSGSGSGDNGKAVIAPFLAFYSDNTTDEIYYKSDVEAGKITIQFSQSSGGFKYQIVLYDNGSFYFLYKSVSGFVDGEYEHSIGWQNETEDDGLTIEHVIADSLTNIADNLIIEAKYDFGSRTDGEKYSKMACLSVCSRRFLRNISRYYKFSRNVAYGSLLC